MQPIFYEDQEVIDISYYWYEYVCKDKEKLQKEINHTMKLLYLPQNAFDYLLYYIFYDEKPHYFPLFDLDFMACIKQGTFPVNEFMGYTVDELIPIQSMAITLLKDEKHKILTSDISENNKQEEIKRINEQIKFIPIRIKDILSKMEKVRRPLKDLEKNIKIVKKLKKYKSTFNAINVGKTEKASIKRITSLDIAQKLNPKIEDEDILKTKANTFRKQVARLKRKFPFLEKFIATS